MKLNPNKLSYCALLLAMLSMPLSGFSQNGINSPYSRFGVGQLSDKSNGMMRSMGGIGTGFRQPNVINLKNPASYSTVDTLTFIADAGFSLTNGNFEENGSRINARNASVDYLAMQYRVLPKVGMTVAFMPFSNMGYSFYGEKLIRRDSDGEITATNTMQGEGGLRQFTAGLGWRTFKWLSLGADFSYLAGNLSNVASTSFSSSSVSSRTKTYEAEFSSFMFDFGAQTSFKLKDGTMVLGATYSPAMDLDSECTLSDVHTTGDTVSIEGAFKLPQKMAAGMSYTWKNCILGADVAYQSWSGARFFGQSYGNDRIEARAGFRIVPDEDSKKLFERTSYQAGLSFAQPYYYIGENKGPLEMGVTAGFSMPVTSAYNSMAYIHVSGMYRRVQPQFDGGIVENYLGISVGVTFMERWFMKWMVE